MENNSAAPLTGRTVLVTGASSGIGRAIAIAAARAGADVALTYRANAAGAHETEDEVRACGRRAIVMRLDLAHEASVPVHLDGARLFNAAVALERPAREFTRDVDSVTFCVSKGLGAPVGSVICGSTDLIGKARRGRIPSW